MCSVDSKRPSKKFARLSECDANAALLSVKPRPPTRIRLASFGRTTQVLHDRQVTESYQTVGLQRIFMHGLHKFGGYRMADHDSVVPSIHRQAGSVITNIDVKTSPGIARHPS